MNLVPKLCGADIELGNFISGRETTLSTCADAAEALLRELPGAPVSALHCSCASCSKNAQDRGRRFLLENGGCFYIDLDHLEMALPEVRSAYDHLACCHAMLRLVRRAQARANEKLPSGERLRVLVNNTDGHGNSYGSHLNILMARRTWDTLFRWKLQHLLFLAAHQVSSIVLTGQGKVGGEHGQPPVPYQIAQRADFIECLLGEQTTYHRPVVNSRDEPLCGSRWSNTENAGREFARLHVIFYDNALCHVAGVLRVGMLQLILCLLETGRVRLSLLLEDPVLALWQWSRDPDLTVTAPLLSGERLTAVELQRKFWEQVAPLVESGDCDEAVPHARELLRLWDETLQALERRDFDRLVGRLDWVLKRFLLERVLSQRPHLSWESPELKHLDHCYSSLDDGLYWNMEDAGIVHRLVTEERIRHFEMEPPEDTRAWTRTMILRRAGRESVTRVDWDTLEVECPGRGMWPRVLTLPMANPLSFTRAHTQFLFRSQRSLEDILECLGATEIPAGTSVSSGANPSWSASAPAPSQTHPPGGNT